MPAGYSARCRVCNSLHRAEVDRWLSEGLSCRVVAARLETEHGERISHHSIWRHRDEHFNVREEAARQYAESQVRLEQAAAQRADEFRLLEEQILEAAGLRAAYAAWLKDLQQQGVKPPQSVVQAYAAAAGEVRQTVKVKQDLLGESPADDLTEALLRLAGDDDPDV